MGLSRDGRWPSRVVLLVVRLGIAAPLALVAGCASDQPQYVAGPMADRVAAASPPKVELEDDGEPVQAPPLRRMRAEEDDPSQPWSRNYGKNGATAEAAGASMQASMGTLTRLSNADAEAVIAQAISAQEMRRQ